MRVAVVENQKSGCLRQPPMLRSSTAQIWAPETDGQGAQQQQYLNRTQAFLVGREVAPCTVDEHTAKTQTRKNLNLEEGQLKQLGPPRKRGPNPPLLS